MNFNDCKCTKATCEKYTLRFNDGWDWAVFTIDDTGLLQCHSSFGDYNYHWNAFGENFKDFLCRIDSHYLLNKTAKMNYFDIENYQNEVKPIIIKMRRENELNEYQARELWDFIMNDLDDYGSSYDLVCRELYENEILNKVCCGEVFYSDFSPSQSYTPNALAFGHKVYPMFVEVLKKELEG